MKAAQVDVPRTLDEALAALADARPDTLLLAGGTDLMVEFESGRTTPRHVLSLWRLDELRGIREEAGGLRLGALTSCAELLGSELARSHADVLVEAASEVGAVQIQNRATLGGNLGTASPAADLNPVLMALGASVRLRSARNTRDLPVEEFLQGYRQTARRPDELIESIAIPARPAGEQRSFRKVGTRRAQSISKLVVALAATFAEGRCTAVRAAAGSVAPSTVLLPSLPAALVGRAPEPELLDAAARQAAREDVAPIDDVRSTGAYRRVVLYRVLRTELAELARRASR